MLIWRDWQQSWLNIGLFFAFLAIVIIDGTFKAQLITVTFWGLLVSLFAIFSLRILFAFNMASLLVLSLWLASEIKYSYLGVRLFWQDFSLAKTTANVLLSFTITKIIVLIIFSLILFLILQARKEIIDKRVFANGICLFLVSSFCLIITNLNYAPNFSLPKPHVNGIAIFLQSPFKLNLADIKFLDSSFCCLNADRKAEKILNQPDELPNIVVVLQESTFDPNVIEGYKSKKIKPNGWPLKVHTVGGMSWVQEISLLHGVPPILYGNSWAISNIITKPYYEGRLPFWLTSIGYETTSIFPVDSRFYGIGAMHEKLGMQNAIDCTQLPACSNKQWYDLFDRVFLNAAIKVLTANRKPQFIFLSTMRQHSPHTKPNLNDYLINCPDNWSNLQCKVMQTYTQRYIDSENDFANFYEELKKQQKRTLVLSFGDHIPTDVNILFAINQFNNRDKYITKFTVWDSKKGDITSATMQQLGINTPIDVAFLDIVIAQAIGLESKTIIKKQEFAKLQAVQRGIAVFTAS